MTAATEIEAPPRWLARFTTVSVALALGAGLVWVWARWALVIAISGDVLAYCFG